MPNDKTDSFTATEDDTLCRLDKLLAKKYSDVSRSHLAFLIDNQHVLVNGLAPKKRDYLKEGDKLTLTFITPPQTDLKPENIPLDIVYEDSYFLAINKAAGMTVHPAPGSWSGTAVNALLYYCSEIENPEQSLRPGIVHRLDK